MFVYLFLRLVCIHLWYLLINHLLIVNLLIWGRRDTIKLIWPSFCSNFPCCCYSSFFLGSPINYQPTNYKSIISKFLMIHFLKINFNFQPFLGVAHRVAHMGSPWVCPWPSPWAYPWARPWAPAQVLFTPR